MIGTELTLKKCVFYEIDEKLVCANVPSILPLQHWLNGSNPQGREAIEALTVLIHVGC